MNQFAGISPQTARLFLRKRVQKVCGQRAQMLIRHTCDIAPSDIELFDQPLMQTPCRGEPFGLVRHDGVSSA